MKKQNLTLALFSCALLSTAYVSTSISDMALSKNIQKTASRSIAQALPQENEVSQISSQLMTDFEVHMQNLGQIKRIPTPRQSSAFINDIIDNINANSGSNVDLVKSLNASADAFDKLIQERETLKKLVEKQSSEFQKLEGEHTELSEAAKSLSEGLAESNLKIGLFEEQVQSKDQEIEKLKELIQNKDKALAELTAELDSLKAARESLGVAIASIEDVEKLKSELHTVTCQNETLTNTVTELERQIADSQLAVEMAAEREQRLQKEKEEALAKAEKKKEEEIAQAKKDKADEDEEDEDILLSEATLDDIMDAFSEKARKRIERRLEKQQEAYIDQMLFNNMFSMQQGMNSYRQQYSFRNNPSHRMRSMQGELDFLYNQNRMFELDRRYGMDRYRDDYRRSYRDDMYSMRSIPSMYDIQDSFHSRYIQGQRTLPNVRSYDPMNYDMRERGYQFDSQFYDPGFSSPILGSGSFDLLAQPISLNS
ncbi:MAG: hypothetical protein VX341_04735 [Bdellovibrionota bacterium]|nr:hypothetical protein [Bdellovibrionota bacterium]